MNFWRFHRRFRGVYRGPHASFRKASEGYHCDAESDDGFQDFQREQLRFQKKIEISWFQEKFTENPVFLEGLLKNLKAINFRGFQFFFEIPT